MTHLAYFLGAYNEAMGKGVAWLTLAMVLSMFTSIVLSFFKVNAIAFQESITWMHGMVFLIGAAFTLKHDEHVRVDIFYSKMSATQKALVNCVGILVLLLPVCIFILWMSASFVESSWRLCESSSEAGGLPARYLFRTLIIMLPIMLIMQAITNFWSNLAVLLTQVSVELNNASKARLDFAANLTLVISVGAYLIFSFVWTQSQCDRTLAHEALDLIWQYLLLLGPLLVIIGQGVFGSVRAFKAYRDKNYAMYLPQQDNSTSEV